METPSPEFRQLRTDDKLSYGCAMGCPIKLGTLLLLIFASLAFRSPWLDRIGFWALGIAQLLGIVPAALNQRAKGKRRVVQGLILTACLGLLLCSACAEMSSQMGPPFGNRAYH